MAYEDFEVRVTKTGEIYVRIEGAHEERIRDYFSFLEENVGSVKSMEPAARDWDRPASLRLSSEDEERQEREQDLRL